MERSAPPLFPTIHQVPEIEKDMTHPPSLWQAAFQLAGFRQAGHLAFRLFESPSFAALYNRTSTGF